MKFYSKLYLIAAFLLATKTFATISCLWGTATCTGMNGGSVGLNFEIGQSLSAPYKTCEFPCYCNSGYGTVSNPKCAVGYEANPSVSACSDAMRTPFRISVTTGVSSYSKEQPYCFSYKPTADAICAQRCRIGVEISIPCCAQ